MLKMTLLNPMPAELFPMSKTIALDDTSPSTLKIRKPIKGVASSGKG